MNKMSKNFPKVRKEDGFESLKKSFDDYRLSNEERFELKNIFLEFQNDYKVLNSFRNTAFDLVQEVVRFEPDNSISALKWLDKVVRTIDLVRHYDDSEQDYAYFSPGPDCVQKIISLISKAKKSLRICVFTISDDNISREIINAHQRGLEIQLYTDNDKSHDMGSDIDLFIQNKIPVKMDVRDSHMHHKFAIIDDRILINGSFNWTRSASKFNDENIVVSYNQGLIHKFKNQFEKLWKEGAEG